MFSHPEDKILLVSFTSKINAKILIASSQNGVCSRRTSLLYFKLFFYSFVLMSWIVVLSQEMPTFHFLNV